MTGKKAVRNTTSAAKTSPGLISNSGADTSWTKDLPAVEESAPGDALYDTLEDFVLDQSEGEESSDDEAEDVEESSGDDPEQDNLSRGGEDDEVEERHSSARDRDDRDNTGDQASRLLTATQHKTRRQGYSNDHEVVLYLLHTYVSLTGEELTKVFNRVFRKQGVIRGKGALDMQWSRFKGDYKEKFANLSTAELAEHELWKKKIDAAIEDGAGVASHRHDKQSRDSDSDGKREKDSDSDSADEHASQLATTPQRQKLKRALYTADHDIVLYLLHGGRKTLETGALAEIFNHIFRTDGIARKGDGLVRHWRRFKDELQKKFANLSQEEFAEHEAWKQKIVEAFEELFLRHSR